MLSWSVQNLTNFVTTFTLPYLVNPESGNLGATVGFIYGVFGIMGVVWAYFYYPELTGRSLEEIDLMLGQDGVNAKQTKSMFNAVALLSGILGSRSLANIQV